MKIKFDDTTTEAAREFNEKPNLLLDGLGRKVRALLEKIDG